MLRIVRTAAVWLVILSWAAIAEAQTSVRYYLVPKIGNGRSVPIAELSETTGVYRPKYTDPGALGVGNDLGTWSAMPYGSENAFLLATDATVAQHNALTAQTDVLAVPTALDSIVSALAVNTLQTRLEAVNLPADWVTTSLTYRDVLRRIGKVIQFAQRFQGLHGARLMQGITLDTRWNQLTVTQQNQLKAAADSFGLDYSAVTNTMTIRQILKLLADQLPQFSMMGNDF